MACCGKSDDAHKGSALLRAHTCYLCKVWKILTGPSKTPEGDPCVTVPGYLIRKPDPCLYSQFLLMQLDKPVTWDNPDVRLFRGGIEQYTYNLDAAVEYDVEITVHNSSRGKPALGTHVAIKWIEFGAGGNIRHTIDNLNADVPVWPGVQIVKTKWVTPVTPGHYCLEVDLSHPDDGNPSNNRGWNNTQVHAANSPVDRPIRIFNQHPVVCTDIQEGGGPYLDYRRAIYGWGIIAAVGGLFYTQVTEADDALWQYLLPVLLAYVLGAFFGVIYYRFHNERIKSKSKKGPTVGNRLDCHLVEITFDSYQFYDKIGKDFVPEDAFKETEAIWPTTVTPQTFLFDTGELFRDVLFHTDAPDDPGPPGRFNINVRQGGEPTGGVTLTITRSA